MIQKKLQCVGKTAKGTQCQMALTIQATDDAADSCYPNPDHPTWPYLCPTCANAAPNKGSRNSKGIVLERPKLS